MDAAAIAKAVQTEIERQQTDVVYNDLSVEELEGVVQHLSARLELCKEALATKQGGKKPEVAALVAKKSEGSWPDLPWTDRTPRRSLMLLPPPPCVLSCGLPPCAPQPRLASRTRRRSTTTSSPSARSASWLLMAPWAPPSSNTSSPRRTSVVRQGLHKIG